MSIENIPADEQDFIVFSGPKRSFSETLMRNIKSDFDFVVPVRFETITEYVSTLGNTASESRLLVIDPVLCAHEMEEIYGFAESFRKHNQSNEPPGLAIAYWDIETGKRLLHLLENRVDLRGMIPMNSAIDIWLSIVRLLASGGTYFPPELSLRGPAPAFQKSQPMDDMPPAPQGGGGLEALTHRELEVLELLSHGLPNKQIAQELELSEHTVKLHIHHIIAKLGVRNRTEAALRYQSLRHPD